MLVSVGMPVGYSAAIGFDLQCGRGHASTIGVNAFTKHLLLLGVIICRVRPVPGPLNDSSLHDKSLTYRNKC